MPLPDSFCWTRFGTEAGQSVGQIFGRKEEERAANAGVFFWGIGNAIGPSMAELLRRTCAPEVLFSPIKSTARPQDCAPEAVVAWQEGETLDGKRYRLPAQSLITSRCSLNSSSETHFALVCYSERPLARMDSVESVHFGELRNVVSGRRIGASQVTAVVERDDATKSKGTSYEVFLRAFLVPPFFLRLRQPRVLPKPEIDKTWADIVSRMWRERAM